MQAVPRAGYDDVTSLTLRAGFTRVMLALGATYLLVAAVHGFVLGLRALALTLLLTASLMTATGVRHQRRPMPAAELLRSAWLVVLALVASWTAHLVVVQAPVLVLFVGGSLIAAGSVLPGTRMLVAADLVALVGLGLAAAPRLPEGDWPLATLGMVLAVAVAHVLQAYADSGRRLLQSLTTGLADDAVRDPLTGLLNRQGLRDAVVGLCLPLDQGSADPRQVAVLCIDVNGFKSINDELGHAAGDQVLVELCDGLRQLVRGDDALARTGGDEFVLLLLDVTTERAQQITERARLRLRGVAGVLQLPWSVSVGCAAGTVSGPTGAEDLMRQADLDMYRDKRAYRTDVVLPEPSRRE